MKYKGVVYDVGVKFDPDDNYPFNPRLVEHDIATIANELHANSIRIEGEPIDRLEFASRVAHKHGLTVFFNPWLMNGTIDETDAYFAEAAEAAERLHRAGVDVVLVAGCELTIMSTGIFPGNGFMDRGIWLSSQFNFGESGGAPSAALVEKAVILNETLARLVATVRARFSGRVTYSAGAWEIVNWDLFDIVGVDHYRRGEDDADYIASLERHRHSGKELVVMEVGCCTYEGAAAQGDGGFVILQGQDKDGNGIWKDGEPPVRSESEQADYVGGVLDLLDGQADGVFIFIFSFHQHRVGLGASDMDMASFSLVKMWPENDNRSQQMPPWEPKEAFYSLAKRFAGSATAVPR